MKPEKMTIVEIDSDLKLIYRWYDRYRKQSHLYTRKWNENVQRETQLKNKRNQLVMRQLP
jgi:hypothetical protein